MSLEFIFQYMLLVDMNVANDFTSKDLSFIINITVLIQIDNSHGFGLSLFGSLRCVVVYTC